jgi:predicted amidohydrolase
MKIAAAQTACAVGDIPANLAKMRDFSERAKASGAEWIVFPEMADTGYVMSVIRAQATSWKEGAVPQLQRTAKDLALGIICGVAERDGESIYNSQVVINAKGEIAGKYRKTHLFSPPPVEEHKCFAAGDCTATLTAGAFCFGFSICYDLRFPELYRKLATEGKVNVFILSSAWPFPRVEHFRILATARAIENQSYVIVSNRVGKDNGVPFCGSSAIIDPYGVAIASASADREELLVSEISLENLQSVRERMPVLRHRRPQVYRAVEAG